VPVAKFLASVKISLLNFKEVALRVVSALLRFFSYLYHTLFALLMVVLGVLLTLAGAGQSLHLEMLPWTGPTAIYVLLFGGIFGLLTAVLAVRGSVRPLFFLWAVAVTVYLVKGYFLGGYRFTPDEFSKVVYLTIGSIVALLGAFLQMFRPSKR
jgi:hypothetical protein